MAKCNLLSILILVDTKLTINSLDKALNNKGT